MKLEIPRPTKPVNSMQFRQASGFDLICSEDKFYLVGEATEAQLLAAYDTHATAQATKKAEQDAIEVQFAKDRASAETKLINAGLNMAEIKANRGEKARVL